MAVDLLVERGTEARIGAFRFPDLEKGGRQ
jgi:hypothetical protein